jgi:hypothetical protein
VTRPGDLTILDAIDSPSIWRSWFRDPATWAPWRAFLAALFGLPLDADALALFRECTGRAVAPLGGFNESWLICGRRAGKSFVLALIAVYLAVFRDWREFLAPGEVGTIKVLATDRRQSRVIHRYCRALLAQVPTLAELVERDSDDEIQLSNGIVIEVQTASFRSVRGYTVIAALLDEIAFWRNADSANPDEEILAAIRPAMATIPGAMLLAASSPYARKGVLWNAYRRHHGRDDAPALVWRADTRRMNATVPQTVIDEATERDPASAAAEYGAEFRTDIETFVAREVVEALIAPGRFELPPAGSISYAAFVDPAGGSGADSFTLAVAHRDRDGRGVLDAIRETRPPFSPEAVIEDYAALLRRYRISRVVGDRWAGEFPREQFRKHGISYDTAEKPKSDIYRELLPLLNSGKVELLDHPRLVAQLCGLERRTARGGRDSIDHAAGAHDDIINSAAGCLVAVAAVPDEVERWLRAFGDPPSGAATLPRPAPPPEPPTVLQPVLVPVPFAYNVFKEEPLE